MYKDHPRERPFHYFPIFHLQFWLLGADHAEVAVRIFGAGGEEELILRTIGCRTAAELYSPEPTDGDHFAGWVCDRTQQFSGSQTVGVDRSSGRVVADQQGLAEGAEVRGRQCKPPRLVQRRSVRKVARSEEHT